LKQSAENAAEFLQLALKRRQAGDLSGALEALRAAYEARPGSLKIVLEYARALAEARQGEAALAVLLQTEAAGRASASVYAALAKLYGDLGQPAQAEAVLAKAALADPDDFAAVLALARAQAADGRRAAAVGTLTDFLGGHADHAPAWLELAALHRQVRAFAEADACYRAVLERDPGSSHAVIGLADILISSGRGAEAVERLANYLEDAPTHAGVLLRHGQALLSAGRGAEAVAAFERAVEAPNASARAWIALASAHVRETSTFAAADVLAEACRRHPDSGRLHLAWAEQTLRIGLHPEARAITEAFIARQGPDAGLEAFLTRLDIRNGRFEAAERRIAAIARQDGPAAERLSALLDRATWRIDEAVGRHETVAGFPDLGPGDHEAEAITCLIALDVTRARARLRQASEEKASRTGGHRRWSSSQGLTREILNDFWTDPGALAAAQSARTRGSTRLWRTTVRENAHHTGSAVGLMVHLRQAGLLDLQAPASAEMKIPRLIHQFWDNPHPPRDVVSLVATWRELNPGFAHTLYDQLAATAYLRDHFDEDVQKAFRRSPSVAGKADILRLALLWREGGVYADADDRCAGPLETLLAGRDLVLRQEIFGSIGNNFIAVTPRHPLIQAALRQSVTAILRGDRESIWLISGPGMLTRAFALYVAETRDRIESLGAGIAVMDQHAMLATCVSGCQATYKQSARGWLNLEFGRR
jgi:predicted Zn-dependent protease